jgi:hypothetical protein
VHAKPLAESGGIKGKTNDTPTENQGDDDEVMEE